MKSAIIERRSQHWPSASGVTVLELLVVVSSLAMFATLLFPAVHTARESSRNVQCFHNLRQIGLALQKYHDSHRALPAGWKFEGSKRSAYGWASYLLHELEEPHLARLVDGSTSIDELDSSVLRSSPAVFVCPSDVSDREFPLYAEIGEHDEHAQESTQILATLPRANYLGVFGTTDPDDVPGISGDGIFVQERPRQFQEITRGLSHVVMVGERTARKLPSTWLGIMTAGEDARSRIVGFAFQGPNRSEADECEFDSRHAEHVNFLWADGHVSAVRDEIDRELYQNQAKLR